MRVTRHTLALVLLTLPFAGAACGEGGDGSRKPVPPGWEAEVEFSRITRHAPGQLATTFLYANGEFQDDVGTRWLDAGKEISFAGPTGDVTLVRRDVLGRIFYQKEPDTDIAPALFVNNASYALRVSASNRDYGLPEIDLPDAILTPDAMTLTSPNLAAAGELVVPSVMTSSISLTWTPGNGDRVEVIFAVASGGEGHYQTFSVADDGDFDVTAAGLAVLPPGEGALTIVRLITTPLALPGEGEGLGIGGDAFECRLVRE